VKQVVLIFVVAGGVLLAWGAWRLSEDLMAEPAVRQPIEFPHKKHLELGFKCTSCHQGAEKGLVAGRPPTQLCLSCHSGGETKSLEVKKLRVFGEKGQEVPWRRVWRLPSHVFFSHRAHVASAKVKCQTCHGPMETLDRPPARPLRTLTMNDCMDCHEKWKWPEKNGKKGAKPVNLVVRRISNDCLTCHR
jgi:predicted CXXCH cytochrome family protein